MNVREGVWPMVAVAWALGCGGRTDEDGSGMSALAPPAATSAPSMDGSSDAPSGAAPSDAHSDAGPGDAFSGAGTLDVQPGCQVGGDGLTNCGPNRESCCASLEVPGGTYFRSYDPLGSDGRVMLAADGGPTGEAHPATVSSFRLDKYDVTVGRFRQFVNAWNGGHGYVPPAGSGKHTHLNGGLGLENSAQPGMYESGWLASDDAQIVLTDENLDCGPATWTPSPVGDETLPINCVDWWEAYAFCIFDGGFLPSEAEWEYAAAGGRQQREYPWGSTSPGMDGQYAVYGNYYSGKGLGGPSGLGTGAGVLAPVGTAPLGAGEWGQLDLVGNVSQWNLDWYANYVDPCVDCANLTPAPGRVSRGGYFQGPTSYLVVSNRGEAGPPDATGLGDGIRCARAP